MSSSPLCIGLSLAATWLSASGWRRPDSRVEQLHGAPFYRDVARRAEQACLDFVFRPDALFLDVPALARGPGFSSLDPALLMAALAQDTRHIGLVTTAATSFNPPYVVARQLQSLDWISEGRAGWNIVTALDGSRNFGDAPMPPSAQRYRKALEFTEVVRALWRSYPQEAVLADRESGQYADVTRIAPIAHRGEYFSVQGPLNVPGRAHGRIPCSRRARPIGGATSPPAWRMRCSPLRPISNAAWRCAGTCGSGRSTMAASPRPYGCCRG